MKINLAHNTQRLKLFSKLKFIVWLIVKFVMALSIVSWLVFSNYHSFVKAIKNIQLSWLMLGFIFYGITQGAAALRWYLLLKIQGIRVSFFETLSLDMQGGFFSLVIPGGAIGGDLVRTGFLVSRTPKGNRLAATSTVFMDRFLGMIAQFSISVFFVFFFIPQIKSMASAPQLIMVSILIISVLGLLAALGLYSHRYLEKVPVFSYLIKISNKFSKGVIAESMEIMDVYNASKLTMVKCVIISIFLFQINMSFILFLIAKGLNCSDISILPLILSIAMGNTAGLLPITPGGLGTRDAVIKSTLTAGGFSAGEAVAIPLIFSIILVSASLLGGLFFLFHKRSKEHYTISSQ